MTCRVYGTGSSYPTSPTTVSLATSHSVTPTLADCCRFPTSSVASPNSTTRRSVDRPSRLSSASSSAGTVWLLCLFILFAVICDSDCRLTVSSLKISPSGNGEGELTRAVGTSVLFTCEAKFTDVDDELVTSQQQRQNAYSLDWYDKNDVIIPAQNHHGRLFYTELVQKNQTIIVKKLYITTIHNKHAGLYSCAVSDGEQRINETRVKLLLYREMVFENSPAVIETAETHSVLLPCIIHGQPEPVVSWRNETNKIKTDGRFQQLWNGLLISNVTSADRGVYFCQGHVPSRGQFKEKAIELILLAAPYYGSQRSTNVSGILGESLIIHCNATGSQLITYEFFKDGNPVDLSNGRIRSDRETGLLILSNLKPTDEGKYLCMASNSVGKSTAERTVKVHNAPSLELFDSIIESRGMSATLLCISNGLPPPEITFYRKTSNDTESSSSSPLEGGLSKSRVTYRSGRSYELGRIRVNKVSPGCAELYISDVTMDDAGVYTCESRNYIGVDSRDATITIGYQPQLITNRQGPIHVWSGQPTPVNITCLADAEPPPVFKWRHKHRWLLDRDITEHSWWRKVYRVYAVNNYTNVLEITMPSITDLIHNGEYLYDDYVDIDWIYGDYICRVKNYFGAEDMIAEVVEANVPCKPRSVAVRRRSSRFVELEVQPPLFNGGLDVTGYQVQNDVMTHHFPLSDIIRVNGLKPSTVYMMSVAAVNDVGTGSSWIITVNTTDLLGPPSPVKIQRAVADEHEEGTYMVTWYKPDDGGMSLSRYRLQYRKVQQVVRHKRQFIATSKWKSMCVNATENPGQLVVTSRLSGLLPHTYYELFVQAENDLDWSPPPPDSVNTSSAYVFLTKNIRTTT